MEAAEQPEALKPLRPALCIGPPFYPVAMGAYSMGAMCGLWENQHPKMDLGLGASHSVLDLFPLTTYTPASGLYRLSNLSI